MSRTTWASTTLTCRAPTPRSPTPTRPSPIWPAASSRQTERRQHCGGPLTSAEAQSFGTMISAARSMFTAAESSARACVLPRPSPEEKVGLLTGWEDLCRHLASQEPLKMFCSILKQTLKSSLRCSEALRFLFPVSTCTGWSSRSSTERGRWCHHLPSWSLWCRYTARPARS